MKTSIIILLCLIASKVCYSQLPQDYPFKVMLDNANEFVYITGEANGDIFVRKTNFNLDPIWYSPYFSPGLDRGIDLVITQDFVYVTGHITNSATGKYDIILLKMENVGGNILWTKTFGSPNYDDQAFGIVDAGLDDVYICGYETNKITKKNIKVYGCDRFGNTIWQTTYDGKSYDDVGTDILTDGNYLYVVGSTYQNFLHKRRYNSADI